MDYKSASLTRSSCLYVQVQEDDIYTFLGGDEAGKISDIRIMEKDGRSAVGALSCSSAFALLRLFYVYFRFCFLFLLFFCVCSFCSIPFFCFFSCLLCLFLLFHFFFCFFSIRAIACDPRLHLLFALPQSSRLSFHHVRVFF